MSFTFRVIGGDAVDRYLAETTAKVKTNTFRRAARAGANVFRDEARAGVEKRSGETAAAIKTTVSTRGGQLTAKVRLRGKHAFLGWLLEFGVAPHWIPDVTNARVKQEIRSGHKSLTMTIGGSTFEGPIRHPGFPAGKFAFMRPAFDLKTEQAVEAFGAVLRKELRDKGYENADEEGDDE